MISIFSRTNRIISFLTTLYLFFSIYISCLIFFSVDIIFKYDDFGKHCLFSTIHIVGIGIIDVLVFLFSLMLIYNINSSSDDIAYLRCESLIIIILSFVCSLITLLILFLNSEQCKNYLKNDALDLLIYLIVHVITYITVIAIYIVAEIITKCRNYYRNKHYGSLDIPYLS